MRQTSERSSAQALQACVSDCTKYIIRFPDSRHVRSAAKVTSGPNCLSYKIASRLERLEICYSMFITLLVTFLLFVVCSKRIGNCDK